jgi:hypothetical protein
VAGIDDEFGVDLGANEHSPAAESSAAMAIDQATRILIVL